MDLLTWLCYNAVLGGLLPVILVRFGLQLTGANTTFTRLVKDGQLFIYSALLAASAIGDLTKPVNPSAHVTQAISPLWMISLVICVMCSTFFFAIAACTSTTNTHKVAWMSYGFTIGSTALVSAMRFALDLF